MMRYRPVVPGVSLLLALVPSVAVAAGPGASTEGLSPWSILASAGLMALGLLSVAVGAVGLLRNRRRVQ
ncbi:MAG: hypothetical protein ACP5UM_08460 [Anaerolineae bacterium]